MFIPQIENMTLEDSRINFLPVADGRPGNRLRQFTSSCGTGGHRYQTPARR
jgi:hypothetical protein